MIRYCINDIFDSGELISDVNKKCSHISNHISMPCPICMTGSFLNLIGLTGAVVASKKIRDKKVDKSKTKKKKR